MRKLAHEARLATRRMKMSDRDIVPDVRTAVEHNGVTYYIMAFRRVTPTEAKRALAAYLKSYKRAPKPGSTVRIISTIGAAD